jgi:glycosyltransferase involved in cell wall biosynthesis
MRIGFNLLGDYGWIGGLHYVSDMITSLKDGYGDGLHIYTVLSPDANTIPAELACHIDTNIPWASPARWTPGWAIDRFTRLIVGYDALAARRLRQEQLDVLVFRAGPRWSGIPSVDFIPDFQYLHLPELFSGTEIKRRSERFESVARDSTRLLLFSHAVLDDLERALPLYAWKARVVRPVSRLPQGLYEHDAASTSNAYHLPSKFIYLPSQFWKHKNHRTAFLATKILNERGTRIVLVCTGYTYDSRNPRYFVELLTELSALGIRDQVVLLGVVPREHVYQLMRQSICALSPSLFEGYGLSVEEARSVGKHLVLSRIPAHIEQEPPAATFFDPRDADELAAILGHMWSDLPPGPDTVLERNARESQPARQRAYAQSLMKVLQEAVARDRSVSIP